MGDSTPDFLGRLDYGEHIRRLNANLARAIDNIEKHNSAGLLYDLNEALAAILNLGLSIEVSDHYVEFTVSTNPHK